MYCPKCGGRLNEVTKTCDSCGFSAVQSIENANRGIQDTETDKTSTVRYINNQPAPKEKNYILMMIYIILAIVVVVMFFIASKNLVDAGKEIMSIQSVGGKTLEEAYYAELGNIYAAYATVVRGMGIFFASVLVWLGVRQ